MLFWAQTLFLTVFLVSPLPAPAREPAPRYYFANWLDCVLTSPVLSYALAHLLPGFSFKGPPRPPFAAALEALGSESRLEFVGRVTRPPIVSVDIPSGWSVDGESESNPAAGRDPTNTFEPEVVVSLTAPKRGIKGYRGAHFLGGRFIPETIVEKYKLEGLDGYQGDDQVVDITNWVDSETLGEEAAT